MENKKSVLLVDDRPENLLVLESIMEELPLTVHKAESGDEALKILLKTDVNLIFLDVRMPGMNGLEAAELIRGKHKTKDIPIIFVSGVMEKEYESFKERHPENVEYLLKPLDPEIIINYANNYLSIG